MSTATNVGICAIEVYFPKLYVDQVALEQHDSCVGKYTKGLGQYKMGVAAEGEDIHSICLTVTKRMLEKYNLYSTQIGFLEVGTETLLDKSKSTKTVLMQLFEDNPDVAGIDAKNACFGGTAALFNAVNWMESSAWDGRLALVVAGDIAVYGSKEARPTGGCGAVAILIGPNAPLVFDQKVRAFHMEHAYDFYKPDLAREYPVVDGRLSVACYHKALDTCFHAYKRKALDAKILRANTASHLHDGLDFCLFHCPYSRLVQKSYARLVFLEAKAYFDTPTESGVRPAVDPDVERIFHKLHNFCASDLTASRNDRGLETAALEASQEWFTRRVEPSLLLSRNVGNMYTASLYSGLVSLAFQNSAETLAGKRILFFSYGSGLAAAMFSARFSSDLGTVHNFLQAHIDVQNRLDSRTELTPSMLEEMLQHREKVYNSPSHTPQVNTENLFLRTYYLAEVDANFRRSYLRRD